MLTNSRIRISVAIALSLGIHVLMMHFDNAWMGNGKRGGIMPRRVTVTLAPRRVQSDKPPALEPIKKQEIVRVAKPEPQKPVDVVVREIPPPVTTKIQKAQSPSSPEMMPDKVPILKGEDAPLEPSPESKVIAPGATMPGRIPVQEARPLYKKNPLPIYPTTARRRRYQGTVILKVLVNSYGKVDALRVDQSSGHEVLDGAALSAVKNWLFEPGRKGDDKTDMWVRVPVRFQLR